MIFDIAVLTITFLGFASLRWTVLARFAALERRLDGAAYPKSFPASGSPYRNAVVLPEAAGNEEEDDDEEDRGPDDTCPYCGAQNYWKCRLCNATGPLAINEHAPGGLCKACTGGRCEKHEVITVTADNYFKELKQTCKNCNGEWERKPVGVR